MRAAWAGLVLLAALPGFALEQEFADIETAKGSFTNVFVTGKSDTHVFIVHNGGKTILRIRELDPATRSRLGVVLVKAAPAPEPLMISGQGQSSPGATEKKAAAVSTPAEVEEANVASAITATPRKPLGKKSSGTQFLMIAGAGIVVMLAFVAFRVFRRTAAVDNRVLGANRPAVTVKTATTPRSPARAKKQPAAGGQDALGRCTMSEEAEAYLKEKYERQFPFRAAKYSMVAPALLFGSAYAARSMNGAESQMVLGVVALLFMASGFFFGVYALWNIRRLGAGKLLIHGLVGTLMNGFLIFMVVTSFDRIKRDFEQVRAEKARTNFVWDPVRK